MNSLSIAAKSPRTLLLGGVAATVLTCALISVATVEILVPRAIQASVAASHPAVAIAPSPTPLIASLRQSGSGDALAASQATEGGVALQASPPRKVAPSPDSTALAAFVTKITHGQGRLVSEFAGPDGLTGTVLDGTQPGQTQKIIGWVLPNMQGMLLGALLDPSGANLTTSAFQTLGISPPSSPSAAGNIPPGNAPGGPAPVAPTTSSANLAAEMAASGFVSIPEGSGPVKLSIFFDSNCSYCHLLWQELHAIPDYQSKFTIQWIPVGIVGPTSTGRGAAILGGGIKGLDYDETNFQTADELGGIAPSSDATRLAEISSNTTKWMKLMSENGQQSGTPTVIVAGKRIIVGSPDQQSLEALASVNPTPTP